MAKKKDSSSNSVRSILNFISLAEKLKTQLRHSWTSNLKRQESVADHTWMMVLLAITLFEKIKKPVDKLKCLKMIAVHDLAEAIVGDVPAFEKSRRQNNKRSNEANALRKMVSRLDSNPLREEIVSLWEEFELGKSAEAKFAKALDKVEVLIQHNITDISTWEDGDYKLNPYYSNDKFDFDQFMRLFKDIVDEDTMAKVESNNKLTRVSGKHRKVWRDSKII